MKTASPQRPPFHEAPTSTINDLSIGAIIGRVFASLTAAAAGEDDERGAKLSFTRGDRPKPTQFPLIAPRRESRQTQEIALPSLGSSLCQ